MAGGAKGESNGLRNLRPQCFVEALHEPIGGKFYTFALFPRFKLKEIESGVGGGSVGQKAKTCDATETPEHRACAQAFINLAHDCVGALQGGRVG
jgi:hypothetical protein